VLYLTSNTLLLAKVFIVTNSIANSEPVILLGMKQVKTLTEVFDFNLVDQNWLLSESLSKHTTTP